MSIKGTDSHAGTVHPADWPSMHAGALDEARLTWLEHRALLATEVRVAPDLSTIIATRRP
ncbi:MAG TPA: hypothetical protein VGP57_02455 [Actinoplanes sp.]|jgi:hypothetical protein|nr:hypothetical protein [Actinoplanes sp.]